jgi:hypothetical protein
MILAATVFPAPDSPLFIHRLITSNLFKYPNQKNTDPVVVPDDHTLVVQMLKHESISVIR